MYSLPPSPQYPQLRTSTQREPNAEALRGKRGRRAPGTRAPAPGGSRGAPDVSPSTGTLAALLWTPARGKINLIVRNTCLGSDQISFCNGANYSELISNQLPLGYKSPQ